MKRNSNRIWRWFVLPLVITLGSIFGTLCFPVFPVWVPVILAGCFLLGLLFFLVTTIAWFAKKRWGAGWAALGCLLLSLVSVIPDGAISFVRHMGSEMAEGDDFAVNLSLPELPKGEELLEPVAMPHDPSELGSGGWDPFQRAQRQSFEVAGTSDSTITPSIPSLAELSRDHPDLLKQYI